MSRTAFGGGAASGFWPDEDSVTRRAAFEDEDEGAAVPFSTVRGALKSLYSAFHFAGVDSLGRPYFLMRSAKILKNGLKGEGTASYI